MHKIYFLLILLIGTPIHLFSSEPPATEVRAVWLTTNYGLDWPRNRTSRELQQELITILDSLKDSTNTVLFRCGEGDVLTAHQVSQCHQWLSVAAMSFSF